ncbi:MAG: hypothetical protein WBA93_37125 [Microcoleaceae cyanobacterium]
MSNLNSHYSEIEWVDQVDKLLREIARASLSDRPKLPDNISERALPLVQKAVIIQQKPDGHVLPPGSKEWVENVRKLLLEIVRASLADIPRLPVHIGQKALSLSRIAQDIKDKVAKSNRSCQ